MGSLGTPPSTAPVAGRALLVSNDSAVVGQLTSGMQQFAITADVCTDLAKAVGLINTRKFEAIVVDFAFGEQVAQILERVRISPSNQNSVTFALVDSSARPEPRVQPNFVMEKPLTDSLVGSTLKAALGLIIHDYRRYFRCPVAIPTVIQIDGTAEFSCKMVNISEGGLAIDTPVVFKPGAPVRVQFTLPGEPTAFDIQAEICWCDKKGRAGLHFQSVSRAQQSQLQRWLSQKIEQGLPEPVAQLFQKSQ